MAKKSRRVTRRKSRRGGVQSLNDLQMDNVQRDLSGPDTDVLLEPYTPVPTGLLSKMPKMQELTKPEDEKVGMLPTPVRKAGRKTRRRARKSKRGGELNAMTNVQMRGVQRDLSGPDTDGLLDPYSPVPSYVLSKMPKMHELAKTKPEDEKVGMTPSQVRKAGRKTRRRARKAKRGGFIPEGGKAFITHAPFAPPDNAFSSFVGTPENTDNSFTLHPSGKKGGKRRRSVKRK